MKCSTCGTMNCMAHGGSVSKKEQSLRDKEHSMKFESQRGSVGVHQGGTGEGDLKGRSAAGVNAEWSKKHKNPGHAGYALNKSKEMHSNKLGELRSMPAPKLKGLAEGGEVDADGDADLDSELQEMCGTELCEAIHKKDSKGIVAAMKALIMSCKE